MKHHGAMVLALCEKQKPCNDTLKGAVKLASLLTLYNPYNKYPEQIEKHRQRAGEIFVYEKQDTQRTFVTVKGMKIKFLFQSLNITSKPAMPTGIINPNLIKANFNEGIILSIK